VTDSTNNAAAGDELVLPSGVKLTFKKRGTGTQKPTPNSIVEVHYEGTFLESPTAHREAETAKAHRG